MLLAGLGVRAIRWAIRQLRFEGATIAGLARQLATTWNTVWSHIKPCLQAASDDPARFAGVRVLGVDEHVWHHQDRRRRGPREFTGIVDLTRGEEHPTARLLDLVPGRSGTAHENWLEERGEDFRSGIQIATLDPFQGYKNAIDDQLQDATSVLDAFHIVKLAGDALDEVRRRVQQDTTGHRGRMGDPLYQIRNLLRASHTQAHPTPTRTTPRSLRHPRPGLHRGRHLDRRLLQPPAHPHQPGRHIPHRIRTTPSGLDDSRINKPSTTCAQPHPSARSMMLPLSRPHASSTPGSSRSNATRPITSDCARLRRCPRFG